ncbi:MAG: hypothetical protein E6G53_10100 [Actinobacteria bacterium]|nr:MAG: hypothetical protein E6G53_10100 [Actinomycetota bacterium]
MRSAAPVVLKRLPQAGVPLRAGVSWLVRRAIGLRRPILVVALVATALLAAYYLWFRDSSFVRVERVTVSGLTGGDAARLRARLVSAAKGMTTLHVQTDELMRALGPSAGVRGLRIETDFPHGLRITVLESVPVAVLVHGGDRVAVDASGNLLPRAGADVKAPAIGVGALPARRLGQGRAERLVACAAAIPAPLRARVLRLREVHGKGLVAYMRHGPLIILGAAVFLREKWAAAAAVLADRSSGGAAYVDVRIPERPVAGGLPTSGATAPYQRPAQTTTATGTGSTTSVPQGTPATSAGQGATSQGPSSAPSQQQQTGPSASTQGAQTTPSTGANGGAAPHP